MTTDSCLQRSSSKWASKVASVREQLDKITADLASIDPRAKTAGMTVYLMEELGDARLRCEELVRYVAEATKLVEKSTHRDHFFEVAGHLIQGIPESLFKLQKAIQAVSLAASRMDYEELKQELRPEKVEELEQVLKDIRIRHVQRRSDPIRPWEQNMIDDLWKTPEAQSAKTAAEPWKATELKEMQDLLKARGYDPKDAKKLQDDGMGPYELEHRLKTTKPGEMGSLEFTHNLKKKASNDEKESRFEEGKPADPTENMSPEDARKWKEEHAKNKDNFKAAEDYSGKVYVVVLTKDGQRSKEGPFPSTNRYQEARELLTSKLGDPDVKSVAFERAEKPKSAAEVPVDRVKGAVASIERSLKDIKHHLEKGEKTPWSDVLSLFNDIRGASATMVRRLDKNASEEDFDPKLAAELPMDVAGDFQAAALALKNAARGMGVKKNTCIAVHLVASAVGKLKEERSSEALYRAYDIMHASGMWDLKEPLEARLACDDDKRSRFEEGKPADPTENMSPEDAKRWKEEHAKNKDNFKSAKRETHLEGKPGFTMCGERAHKDTLEDSVKDATCYYCKQQWEKTHKSAAGESEREFKELNKLAQGIAHNLDELRDDCKKLVTEMGKTEGWYAPNMSEDEVEKLGKTASDYRKKMFGWGGISFVKKKASGPNEQLYSQIRPGCGVTIVTPHGHQVTGMAIAPGPAGWILNVKGRPGIAHPENVVKVAGNEEKESRFEEGKPADPTENMSPEDAEKWKEEHAKNKDNFKAAARIVPLHEAKKGDMVEIPVGVPWPRDSKKEKFTGKVVRVLKDGGMLINVEKTRDNPGGHPNEDVGYVEIGPPKKEARDAEAWKADDAR